MRFEIFRFEVKQQLQSPVFWVSATLFCLAAFLLASVDALAVDSGGVGGVHRNAPYVMIRALLQLSFLGIFATTAFVAGSVVRDHEEGMHEILYSTPVTKRHYLLGRFGGGMLASLLLFALVTVALAIGAVGPWNSSEPMGPFRAGPLFYALVVVVAPSLILFGSIAFAAATATRSMIYAYVSVFGVLAGYLLGRNLMGDLATESLAARLDPFGWSAFVHETLYWTVAQRNRDLPSLPGPLLENRLLWIAVGAAVFSVAYARFSFQTRARRARGRDRPELPSSTPPLVRSPPRRHPPGPTPAGARLVGLRQLLDRIRFDLGTTLRSLPFLVILGLGLLVFTSNARTLEQFVGGMRPLPVTGLMVEIVTYFGLYVLILLTVYAAELSWRDRVSGMAEIVDAMPAPTWALWGGVLGTLTAMVGLALALAIGVGVAVQLAAGFTDVDWGLYLRGVLLVEGIPFALFAVLALAVQVVVNHRFGGYLGLLVVGLAALAMNRLGIDHPLFLPPGAKVPAVHSDMNGYAPYVPRLAWFYAYWALEAVLLGVVVHLFWVRGRAQGFRSRLARARQRWTAGVRAVTAAAALLVVASGSWILYNTSILNEYVSPSGLEALRAGYERQYRRYRSEPQPTLTGVRSAVDFDPARRAVEIRGTYELTNAGRDPIASVHVTSLPLLDTVEIGIDGATLAHRDPDLGYRVLELERPLRPGESLEMDFRVSERQRGFLARGLPLGPVGAPWDLNLTEGVSVVRSGLYFPHIGYTPALELADPRERAEHALGEREPPPPPDAPDAGRRAFPSAGWIYLETVVSTSADQVALAPGVLVREWSEDGRRYFHYRVPHPMEPAWVLLSGRWQLAHGRWKDTRIELYHHEDHPYNVEEIIDVAEVSLEVFSDAFGPYPEEILRIIEYPRYDRGGESHSTQVLISESAGFIAEPHRDPEELDFVFRITAHEIAHEWWGNSTLSALALGRMIPVESLAEYSVLVAAERRYGPAGVRRNLRHQLERYLRGRGAAARPERPLVAADEAQAYVSYAKGAMALYAVGDHFGQEEVNRALSRYYADHAFQGPPFATSLDLVAYLEPLVPADRRSVLRDWFETITLWDLRAAEADVTPRRDGRYLLRLSLESTKLRADADGVEREIPIDDWIDVAVFGESGNETAAEPLYLRKHRIRTSDTTLSIVLEEEPERAGIDPFHKLIDPNPDDNVVAVRSLPDPSAPPSRPRDRIEGGSTGGTT